jgi:hypothetical protein
MTISPQEARCCRAAPGTASYERSWKQPINKGIFLLTAVAEPIVRALHKPAVPGDSDQEQVRSKIFFVKYLMCPCYS